MELYELTQLDALLTRGGRSFSGCTFNNKGGFRAHNLFCNILEQCKKSWLFRGFVGDYTAWLCEDYFTSHYKDSY